MTLILRSDCLELTLEPAFGARVTTLTDRRSGRQWLVAGDCVGSADDQATYGAAQACGWDECFPNIAPGHDPVWGDLRDHGALWGRPWQVTQHPDPQHCTTVFRSPLFDFERSLTLDGAILTADYRVTNRSASPLPYLWSQHALLATTAPDRLALHGIADLVTGTTHYLWPDHPARNLTQVGALHEGFMQKSYASTPEGAAAEVLGPNGSVCFDWAGDVTAFGLWLDYGGWPADAPVHQIAFEPTTAMADDLDGARVKGQLRWLERGSTDHWAVSITVTNPPSAKA